MRYFFSGDAPFGKDDRLGRCPGCRLDASPDRFERKGMSTADELAKLDALRQSGVLTQEEFDAEKAELLVASHGRKCNPML